MGKSRKVSYNTAPHAAVTSQTVVTRVCILYPKFQKYRSGAVTLPNFQVG